MVPRRPPGLISAACFELVGTVPWVTAWMTIELNCVRIPSACNLAFRFGVRWAFTIAPTIATPKTAPSSRLVFVAEAAIPECSRGIELNTVVVTGTSAMPKPMPAIGSDQPSWPNPTFGPSRRSTVTSPAAPSRHPVTMGARGPLRATQNPVPTEAAIIRIVIGTKSSAVMHGL